MHIVVFEDNFANNFEPLAFYRPVYDLVCGIYSLKEKILNYLGKKDYSLYCREFLTEIQQFQNPDVSINRIPENTDSCIFINGRLIAQKNLKSLLQKIKKEDSVIKCNGNIVAFRISGKNLTEFKNSTFEKYLSSKINNLPSEEVNVCLAEYVWDFIKYNGDEIIADYNFLKAKRKNKKSISGKISKDARLLNKNNIIVEKGVEIKNGVILDAQNGPIYIGKNSVIDYNSVIIGPVCIGDNSRIKPAAIIYNNVSIGNVCKVGGEVEDTIILSYSNKQHPGFLGHGYLGSWVNIGADTNCSDLKNNYSTVKVFINGKTIDTKLQFLGLIMGDHSKTAINTMFNTGTIVGFSCNVFGAGFPEKYLPSFSWGAIKPVKTYDVNKSIETAKIVQKRRNILLPDEEKKLFLKIFELTINDRKLRGIIE